MTTTQDSKGAQPAGRSRPRGDGGPRARRLRCPRRRRRHSGRIGCRCARASCIDTSGDTIKLGFLNSLTGGMAISEKTVSNVLHMAADEINADGGILGKQIEYVQEDGATDWPTFAEKTEKLLTQDCVAAIFGGWTSSSRKAVKPVVEEHNGLFFYPVQYEGLEASPNIYYTGATTNQQIIPAMDYLAAKGVKTLFLAGSDYVFPRTANAIIKLYAAELGIEIVGEEYVPLDKDDWTTPGGEDRGGRARLHLQHHQRLVERRLHQGLLRRRPHPGDDADHLGVDRRGGGAGHGSRGHRPLRVVELLPVARHAEQPEVHRALEGLPRQQRRHLRPDGGRVHLAVPLQGPRRGGRFVRRRRGERRGAKASITVDAPEGVVTLDGENHHISKPGHIGRINADNQFDIVWSSDRLHRARPVPRGVRLVPGRRPRRARSRRGLIAPLTGRGVPCPPGTGPRGPSPLQNSRPHRERKHVDALIPPLLNGTALGALLLLAALGLTLTFGQMGVINMAHGEFIMVGAFIAYMTQLVVTSSNISILLALPLAFVGAGLLGLLLEIGIIQWMYRRPLDTLLVTVGVA